VAKDLKKNYSFDMGYDAIHNITQKNQLAQKYSPEDGLEKEEDISYSWMYAYKNSHPHAASRIGNRDFFYDADVNLIRWEQHEYHDHKDHKSWRDIVWDEENRVRSILDGSGSSGGEHDKQYRDEHIQRYVYDDAGTRVLKYGHGEDLTVYVNSYFTVSDHAKASKHIFAGNVRMATMMVEYHDEHEHDRDTEEGHHAPVRAKETPFFYHGDHLGSNHYVTDARGRVYEHLEYFPFGEQWVEEGESGPAPKYRFTAKGWDAEIGFYYFGARYYDPRTSVWISPDPILYAYLGSSANKLKGMGGVYNPANLGLYSYTYNNPMIYVDPDGRSGEFAALRLTLAFAAADLSTPDPTDAGAPAKLALYGSAVVGTAIGGGLSYALTWAIHKAQGGSDDGTQSSPSPTLSETSPMVTPPGGPDDDDNFGQGQGDQSAQLNLSDNAARGRLSRAMGQGEGQAHHIIPWQLRNHPLVQRAARGGFNMNATSPHLE